MGGRRGGQSGSEGKSIWDGDPRGHDGTDKDFSDSSASSFFSTTGVWVQTHPPPNPSTTLTLPSHSLMALAHSIVLKGGFPCHPSRYGVSILLRTNVPPDRISHWAIGHEIGVWARRSRGARGKGPGWEGATVLGVCSRGTLSPNRWGDR